MSEAASERIYAIIPAFNEENSVGKVVADLPKSLIEEVVVVNNNSNDKTSENAINAGATVLDERIPGYGRACLKGISYVSSNFSFSFSIACSYPSIQEMRPFVTK